VHLCTLYTRKETTHTKDQYCQTRWWRPRCARSRKGPGPWDTTNAYAAAAPVFLVPVPAWQPRHERRRHRYDSGFRRWRWRKPCLSLSPSSSPRRPTGQLPLPPPPAAASRYAPFASRRPPNDRAQRHPLSTLDVCLASPAPRGVVQDGALRARLRLRRRGSGGRGREAEAARGVHGDGRGGARSGVRAAPAVPVLRTSLGALALPLPPPRPLHDVAVHWRQKVMPPYCLAVQCSFR